jgi:hypothetical protein
MPRPRLLFALLALCLSASAFAACGGGSEESPQQVLEGANLEGVESADFEVSLEIDANGKQGGDLDANGKQGGDLDVTLSGRAAPEGIDVDATVAGNAGGKPVDFEGGLTLLADHGFVDYQGTEYEIDPANYSLAKELFFPLLSEEALVDLVTCREAVSRLVTGELIKGLHKDGTVDVAGAEATKLSGELDVAAAAAAMIGLTEDPGCSGQFEALSPESLTRIRSVTKSIAATAEKAEVDIYVGGDHVIRGFGAEFVSRPGGARAPIVVDLELTLGAINADQKIEAPPAAKPVGVLFGKLGINPLEFITWSSGGEGVRVLGEKVAADAFP